MEAEQRGRLRDILDSAQRVSAYVADMSWEQFAGDTLTQDAVLRRLEIIGEATRHLKDATRNAIPELPFDKIRGLRNIVAHDYENVNLRTIWEIATVNVPDLIRILDSFFASVEQISPETPP